MINWDRVKFFIPGEFQDPNHPGSGELIDGVTLLWLVELRIDTGWPIKVHWEVGGAVDMDGSHGHAKDSFHLAKNGCMAVDFHFITKASLRKQFYAVMNSKFSGIGIYPEWDNPGFHVDPRHFDLTQIWKKVGRKYIYFF